MLRVAASENVSVLRLLCEGEAYLALGARSSVETNLHLFTGGKNVALYTCLPGHTCRAGFDDETSASQHLTQAVDWALATGPRSRGFCVLLLVKSQVCV